jgi:glutamate-1-semialdehyde aminotransferase
LKFDRSHALLARALEVVPGASQTFSKGHTQFVRGASPVFVERARGCIVQDVDGGEYLDTTMGLAPVVLGYADPDVDKAVATQLEDGTIFSLPHPLEVYVAETICRLVPCAEMVRFGKNGSDATSGAVRLARAHTGRDRIACCGYHGWHDWYIATTTMNAGIPAAVCELTHTFAYNDLDSLTRMLDAHPGEFAAVVMEPVGVVAPEDGFLEGAAEAARAHGALLVFDEVITGFRFGLGGAGARFGVTPDLAALGKAMANGYPLSAVVGRRELMEGFTNVFFSGTFGGETLSLAACSATLAKLESLDVPAHLEQQGTRLQGGLGRLLADTGLDAHVTCAGLGPRSVVSFRKDGEDWWDLKSLFQQECIRRGLLFTGGHNMCLAHTGEVVDEVLAVYGAVVPLVAEAVRADTVAERLEGTPVQPVFRKA